MSNSDNSGSENIRCIVRCRPLNEKEIGLGSKCITISSDSKVVFVENKNDKLANGKYAMDHVFNENVTQEEVFQEIGEPILKSFIGGYNCTIFCYGQTGAGKTHTMMGPLEQLFEENSPSQGLIPRIIHYLFNEETKVKNIITGGNSDKCKNIKMNIKFCVMELYQESIIDLLKSESSSNTLGKNQNDKLNELKIKEDPKKGMYVQGITEVEIKTAKEAKNLILMGLKSRHVAATEMNAESSRSHLLFSIFLTTSYINNRGGAVEKTSRLHLIDLAGSERQKKTKAQGERIKEACMINKSLSTLGNVINALVENYEGKNKYIPFRDSKLTYFLKDSLGGNSKTTIVANISTSLIQMNETISTLKFVQRAKMIKNSATLNMSVQENIEALQEEIKKLKSIIAKGGKYIDENDLNNNSINNSNGGNNNTINNKDYICPICNNQPIEVNQEKIFQNFKNEINQLMELIIKNFKSEESIRNQFMNLDNKIISSGFQFYSLVEKYKSEYDQKLKELDSEVKLYQKFISEIKENMNKANEKIINFKLGDAMDRIIFGQINQLNIQADEILKKLESCDITYFKKIEAENQLIQKEKQISEDIKKILELKVRNEIEQKEINTNAKNVQNSVEQFINSNDKIIKFFAENFLNKSYFKEELVLLEKSKYDMLLFQIDEGKMTERSLKKQMEQIEMDIYLSNIDILRMKSQLDAYKSNKRVSQINSNSELYFRKNSNINDTKNINTIKEEKNEEEKNNKDIIKEEKNEVEKNNKDIIKEEKNEEHNNIEDNENNNKSDKSDNENNNNENTNNDNNNDESYDSNPDESNSDKENDNDKNEKEEEKEKEKEEVKEEVTFNRRPIDRKRTRKGIIRVGSLDATATLEKTKKFAFNVDNLEIIKMKERLDELNTDLSEKISENEDLKQEVFDLNNIIENLNIKIQENDDNIKQLNIQIEALDTTNEVFEKNMEELSNYKKFVDKELEDIIIIHEQNNDKIKQLIQIINKNNEIYKNKCDELFKKNKDLIIKNEEKKNIIETNNKELSEVISDVNNNENNFISLYDKMSEYINYLQDKLIKTQDELNNLNKVKNEIAEEKKRIEEKNKEEINSLNNDIYKYKNIIINKNKIIQIYIENEQFMKLEFEEIEKLIASNDTKINNLNEIYSCDLSLINKYYINVILSYRKLVINSLDKNDNDIADITKIINNNENSIDGLNKIYNSFNNLYFDKCCNLLNEINKKEIENKYLQEKLNLKQITENNLNQKISSLEQENSIINQENKNSKQSLEIKIKDNNYLKKQNEDLETQIKNLRSEITEYLEQIKQKEKIFDEINNTQKKININMQDLENRNKSLNLTINEKNLLINKLQSELDKINLTINELNQKNLSLIQELETEKNNDSLNEQENIKNISQYNELNNKISTLFTEIGNKDKIITQLNNEHAELSKQISDFILEKNQTMENITKKEEEINKLQQNIYELNNKISENNEKINQIITEKKEKNEEIAELKKNLNESKQNIEEKNDIIKKLNNKLRMFEQFNKKGISMNNYFNSNSINDNAILKGSKSNLKDEKSLNGMIHINYFNNEEEPQNTNKFIIDLLKKKNEELINEKIQLKNEIYELNTRNTSSDYLSNLYFKLLNEFNNYQTNAKNNKNTNSLFLPESFIKEKITKNNNELNSIEKELNEKTEKKTNISNNIVQNISEYIDIYNSSIDLFLNNYNSLLQKVEEEEKEKENEIQEILDEILVALNQLNLNNISTFDINQELSEILTNINKVINTKLNSFDNLIKALNESYNTNVILEEINCNDNIIYYNGKNQNSITNNKNNKNKLINQEQNDDEKILQSYNDYSKNIFNAKNKYKEIINQFCVYKNSIIYEKSNIEKYLLLLKNMKDNNIEKNNDNKEEINYDMKLILNKIQNDKNSLRQIINRLNDNININANTKKECLDSIPDNSKLKESIEKEIIIKDEIEDNINEIKSNYLLMKNLPKHYESYKKYLSISILERKNKILEEKLKMIFGDKFNINNIYNSELKPEIIWNKNEIPKLTSQIMILRENKNLLEKDYNALQLAFNLALKGKEGINDNQMIILLKIKEENKQLKKELKKIKDKNNILQEKIKKYNKENNNNKINLGNDIYENNNTNINNNYFMYTLADCSISEIKDNNNIKPKNIKKKINHMNDPKDNNSLLNDMSNGFTPKRKKRKIISCEK